MPVYGVDYANMGGGAQVMTDKPNGTMGKDEFLQLLVAQLQAQDPLKPMESTEFTAQLAQFSSLEQLQNIDTNLTRLQTAQSSLNNTMAVEFVGKSVTASGNTFQLEDGHTDDIHFELHSDAKAAYVNIYDQGSNLVKTIETGSLSRGEHHFSWDGIGNRSSSFPDGFYSFEVMAVDPYDQMVGTSTFVSGTVTAVSYRSGLPVLMAGDREIPFGNVLEVNGSPDTPDSIDTVDTVDAVNTFEKITSQTNQMINFYRESK